MTILPHLVIMSMQAHLVIPEVRKLAIVSSVSLSKFDGHNSAFLVGSHFNSSTIPSNAFCFHCYANPFNVKVRENQMNQRIHRAFLTIFLICTLPSAIAHQTGNLKAEIVEFGIYYTSVAATATAPNTTSGEITLLNNPMHVRTTDTIPALTKSSFGLRYQLAGLSTKSKIAVTDVVIAPGLQNPSSDSPLVRVESSKDVVRGGQTVFIGYTFDESWEAVPGDWTIEVWHGEIMLLSKLFTVVPAKPLLH